MGRNGEDKLDRDKAINKLLSLRFINEKGCWLWLGSMNGNGYGQVMIDYISYGVHRLSLHLFKNFDLSSPLNALHTCDRSDCFNPDHLYEGNQSNNLKDAYNRKRRSGNNLGGKSHCRKGYEFTVENTYIRPDTGTRACRICRQACEDRRTIKVK